MNENLTMVLLDYIKGMLSVANFTLGLAVGGTFCGILSGLCLAIFRHSGTFQNLIKGVISILRGTPTILILTTIHFTLARWGFKVDIFWVGIIGIGLASSVDFAEIIRAGIESLPQKQFEVAKTLKVSFFPMWKDIILPQTIANICPALINEIVSVVKNTSLVGVIGGVDILRKGQMLASVRGDYYVPYCVAGIFYIAVVLVLEYLEKKLKESQ